jgi:chromosome segregation ATPase
MFGTADLLKQNEELTKLLADTKQQLKELKRDYEALGKDLEKEKGVLLKAMELDFKQKMLDEVSKVKDEYNKKVVNDMEENFGKLKNSLSKLHEEGNANTRYLENITLKMMDAMNVNISNKRISNANDSDV